jgi:RNA polymerase sigma-70 factor, ECF subfamily
MRGDIRIIDMKAMKDEDRLIRRVVSGHVEEYAELVNRYHVGVIIHCERMLGDRQDAEDIAQEAFITAFTKLSDFDAKKAKFSTWLYRIATNKALDHIKSTKRNVDVDDVEVLLEHVDPVMDFVERDRIRKAVAALMPPEYAQAIEAYFWQGQSYEEIAQAMHVPRATIGTWIRRAKQQLVEVLS